MKENIILERIKFGNKLFSILSLISCILILILILLKKELRSLTYNILKFVFCSEILHNIGNLIQAYDGNKKLALSFLSFSDIFTYLLILLLSFCSVKLITETDRTYKDKYFKYILISLGISFTYFICFLIVGLIDPDHSEKPVHSEISVHSNYSNIDIRFKDYYYPEDKKNYTDDKRFYYLSCIHTVTLISISFLILHYTQIVFQFLNNKLKTDKVNSAKTVGLIKILLRYCIISFLYWVFLIPRVLVVSICEEDDIFRDFIYLFSESFFCMRGLLLFLNTISSSKIKMMVSMFIEINIKHYILLNYRKYSKKKIQIKNSQIDEEPLIIN